MGDSYSNEAISTIIYTPKRSANISLIDCHNFVSDNNSGRTDTVAIYINPPAVNGNIHAVAISSG